MNSMPSLRGIETFMAVAEVLNFRIAAERLNVTVSAVSHRIHGLESMLGIELFDRNARPLRLTVAGGHYLEAVKAGMRALQDAGNYARTEPPAKVIRVAAPPVFHSDWLVPRLNGFVASHPNTTFELLTIGTRRAANAEVNVASLSKMSERAGAVPFYQSVIAPVCRPGYAEAHGLESPADLAKVPLIELATVPQAWSSWFKAAGLSPNMARNSIMVDSQTLVCEAAAQGLGVGLAASIMVAHKISDGVLETLFDVFCPVLPKIELIVRGEESDPLLKAFGEWLRVEMKEAAGGD